MERYCPSVTRDEGGRSSSHAQWLYGAIHGQYNHLIVISLTLPDCIGMAFRIGRRLKVVVSHDDQWAISGSQYGVQFWGFESGNTQCMLRATNVKVGDPLLLAQNILPDFWVFSVFSRPQPLWQHAFATGSYDGRVRIVSIWSFFKSLDSSLSQGEYPLKFGSKRQRSYAQHFYLTSIHQQTQQMAYRPLPMGPIGALSALFTL